MIRFDGLSVFVLAAGNGNLSAAARLLDIAPTVASAAIRRLEAELGVRLLAPSTRSRRLTSDGARYVELARNALSELRASRDALIQGRDEPHDTLMLSIPSDLGRSVDRFDNFAAEHPAVGLNVRMVDARVNIFPQPVNAAVR